jgi:hypothetical protein
MPFRGLFDKISKDHLEEGKEADKNAVLEADMEGSNQSKKRKRKMMRQKKVQKMWRIRSQ